MRRQQGFTIYEMVLTITIFITVTSAIAAYVSGSFDTTRTRAQTLLQQVKTIETAFAAYVAVNNYNSKIFSHESAQMTLNAVGMQQTGHLKGFNVKALIADKIPAQWRGVSYVDFSAVEKNLIGSVFATRLLTGTIDGHGLGYFVTGQLPQFFLLLLIRRKKLAIEFYNLCNDTTITALPVTFPAPQIVVRHHPRKKMQTITDATEHWGAGFCGSC